ncbi:MAG: GIY-YIG nuclease family protein [Pirellulales bacterium]
MDTAPAKSGGRTAREQRIIAGFEEIERFVQEHGRAPEHGANRDIFERLYAVRLDRMRESEECREVLRDMDSRGLLSAGDHARAQLAEDSPSDEELLASLGVEASPANDVTKLVHVRSRAEIKAAEEVARRTPCEDFAEFKPIFERVQHELETGELHTVKFGGDADIQKGDLFILDGQKVMVVDLGESFVSEYDRPNRRLRVVYDNGTESTPLLRSLLRALYEDQASRRIIEAGFGPLFADVEEEGDLATGYIYVLRSKSENPFIAEHRSLIHKIGVTGGDVKVRVANARKDPTYLLADVEIVATYKLANVNRKALEALLQKFFGRARLDLELKDRFGSQVEPREWFLVPLPVIDEAIEKLKEGTIGSFRYDPEAARLTPA